MRSPRKIEADFTKSHLMKRYGSALEKVAVDRLSSEKINLREYGQSQADLTLSDSKDYNNFSQFNLKTEREILPELIKRSKY